MFQSVVVHPRDDDRILEDGRVGESAGRSIQPKTNCPARQDWQSRRWTTEFLPEEPRRSPRTPGGVWFEGSPPITKPERNLPMNDPTPPQATPTAPTLTAPVEPHTKATISDAEAATMADWARKDLAAGKINSEQAEKIFSELNTPLEQRSPDTRTDEQKTLDHHFPAAKPEDYLISYFRPGEHAMMTPALKQFDSKARAWLSWRGIPAGVGQFAGLTNLASGGADPTHEPGRIDHLWGRRISETATSPRPGLGGQTCPGGRNG